MKLALQIVLLAALWAAGCSTAKSGSSALGVARAFCDRGASFDKDALYTGEMHERFADQPTLGQSFEPGARLSAREVFNTGVMAMVAVEATRESTDEVQDYYVYLDKDGLWRISAVRSLWLPGLFYAALEELEKKGDKRTAEEQHFYELSKLTICSDRFLKGYLQQNLQRFNQLVELHNSGKHDAEKAAASELRLHGNLETRAEPAKGLISYIIGGMIDNEVGYLYVPAGAKPPKMSPGGYILVDHITGPWYLYKTT